MLEKYEERTMNNLFAEIMFGLLTGIVFFYAPFYFKTVQKKGICYNKMRYKDGWKYKPYQYSRLCIKD